MSEFIWPFLLLLAGIYCIARAVSDFRQKNYVWAAFGLLGAAAIFLMPMEGHAIKVDLPAPSSSQ
ncbi:hypothetical protein [Parasphingorhabdus sp.]|uniref:hypothetical protein n=1 Tax=Parasphingorhabdus sp. TaxID=2709688 RepID=UPI003A8DC328